MTTEQALQRIEQPPTMALDAVGRKAAIDDLVNKIALVQEVMAKVMKEGEHWGKVPGCGDKPALLKAGAEKLGMTFRLKANFDVQERDLGRAHREYSVRCMLSDGNMGVGSCSTMESKYRYRSAERTCPACGKGTIRQSKKDDRHPNGGFYCWAKLGGCGLQFEANDERITGQQVGKIEHDNPADFYNCVSPETKVLTRDLQWIPVGEIESGDLLIGVNETATSEYARNFAIGEATVHGRKLDELYEVTFQDGRVVRCNGDHKWLVKKIGLKGTEWVQTSEIHNEILERKGRPRHWTVMSALKPWMEDSSKEAGYIAGLVDADGSLGSSQLTVFFSQQANTVLTLYQRAIAERGYKVGISPCRTPETLSQSLSQKQVYSLRILGGMAEQLRFLGSIRPPRLLERWLNLWNLSTRRLEGRGSGAGKPVGIASLKKIGKGEIVLLGTTCHTYLAEGLVCHNTALKMAKKRAHVDAIITATACSDIFTQDVEDLIGQPETPPAVQTTITPPTASTDAPKATPRPAKAISEAQAKKDEGQTTLPRCTVKMVTEKHSPPDAKKPWTAYFILLNDGFADLEAGTFSKTLAGIASTLSESYQQAEVTIKPGKIQGRFELVNILPVGEPEHSEVIP